MTWQRPWNHALAAIDPLARVFGAYTAYTLSASEYVGTIHVADAFDAADVLKSMGYEANPLAAAKYHPDPHHAVDHGGYRRVPDEHPDLDARITRDYAPRQCQYHPHLWPGVDGVEVFSHYEVRPDLHPVASESVASAYNRLKEHYRPDYGETLVRGVTDLEFDA